MDVPRLTLHRCLRAGVFVLLLLGVAARPIIGALGSLHAAEHARMGLALGGDAGGHAHDHGEDHDHDNGGDDDSGGDDPRGIHSLMHLGVAGAGVDALPALSGAASFVRSPPLRFPDATAPPPRYATSPFRPPIA